MAVPRATLGWPGRSRPGSDELFGLLVRSWQLDGSFQLLGMSFANMEQDVDRVEEPVYTQLRRQHFWLRQRVLLKCRKRLPMLRCSQRNRLASGRDLRLRAGKSPVFRFNSKSCKMVSGNPCDEVMTITDGHTSTITIRRVNRSTKSGWTAIGTKP